MLLTSNSSDASEKLNLLQASNLAAESKESQVSNTPMSNVNVTSTKEATMKEVNPPDSSFMESLSEDTNIDDLGQRSINNNALSKDLDQSEHENDIRLHEEVRVHSWNDIEDSAKEHMWQSVLNKFDGKGYPLDRGPENTLKETPNDLTPEDWNWLVKEPFMNEDFKKVSSRNSSNRENLNMLPRTGSKPFRQIIWEEMGGKEGNDPPPISAIFKRTREGKFGKLHEAEAAKHEEIVAIEQDSPSLSHFEVVEKCFGSQYRGSVVCFGFGVRPKDVLGKYCIRF